MRKEIVMKLQKSIAVAPFVAVLILTACVLAACSATDKQTATEGVFTYEHDSRENPNAMKDIIENPDAVYGFSPSPESDRLKEYVDAIDWTNPDRMSSAEKVSLIPELPARQGLAADNAYIISCVSNYTVHSNI